MFIISWRLLFVWYWKTRAVGAIHYIIILLNFLSFCRKKQLVFLKSDGSRSVFRRLKWELVCCKNWLVSLGCDETMSEGTLMEFTRLIGLLRDYASGSFPLDVSLPVRESLRCRALRIVASTGNHVSPRGGAHNMPLRYARPRLVFPRSPTLPRGILCPSNKVKGFAMQKPVDVAVATRWMRNAPSSRLSFGRVALPTGVQGGKQAKFRSPLPSGKTFWNTVSGTDIARGTRTI